MAKHIIIANYGNDSVALIQWALEAALSNILIVNVDTGWAAPQWSERVKQCQTWVTRCGFTPIQLNPEMTFTELMQARGEFPTPQFQWCANYLKALPILDWLDDEVDPRGEATIMLATQPNRSLPGKPIPEWIETYEHFGERRVWQALYQHTLKQRNALIERAGFSILPHRSLECDPCINSDINDVLRLEDDILTRTAALEQQLAQPMLDPQIYQGHPDLWKAVKQLHSQGKHFQQTDQSILFDAGCGRPVGCGM